MVNHDIVWLYIPVHDSHAVAVVECLQQFVQVETDIVIGQCLIQQLEVSVIDVLKDQCWSPRNWVLNNSLQRDDIGPPSQVFQDFYFSLYLLLFHRLQAE